MNKVGFVGMGNMAQAMAEGFLKSGKLQREAVLAYAPHKEKLYQNGERIGFLPVDTLEELVRQSEIIIIACKPYQISEVLTEVKNELTGKAILSVAAGWVFDDFHAILGDSVRIQCIMPNTPAMVGEGVMLFCPWDGGRTSYKAYGNRRCGYRLWTGIHGFDYGGLCRCSG